MLLPRYRKQAAGSCTRTMLSRATTKWWREVDVVTIVQITGYKNNIISFVKGEQKESFQTPQQSSRETRVRE